MKKSLGMRIPHGECSGIPIAVGAGLAGRLPAVCGLSCPRGGAAWAGTAPRPFGALLPSHAVHLARLVTDDVPHPATVHPARGRAAATGPAATREAGVPVR